MITLGADPEYLVLDEKSRPVPACDLIGGTKKKPIPLTEAGRRGFFVHEDNVSVELAIPATARHEQFATHLTSAKKAAQKLLPEGYTLVPSSCVEFSPDQLLHPKATEFGCEPDFDGYAGGKVRRNPPDFGCHRFFGGHIHIGGKFNCPPFVAACFADLRIALPLLRQGHTEHDSERKRWYGAPGIYRPKSYGIEYRTLDSYWTMSSMSSSSAGALALDLGYYLEKTPADQLRKSFQSAPWGLVREAILARTRKEFLTIDLHIQDHFSRSGE